MVTPTKCMIGRCCNNCNPSIFPNWLKHAMDGIADTVWPRSADCMEGERINSLLSVCSCHMGSLKQWLPHQGDKETRHTVKTGWSFSFHKVILLYDTKHEFSRNLSAYLHVNILAERQKKQQARVQGEFNSDEDIFCYRAWNWSLSAEVICWKSNLLLLQTLLSPLFNFSRQSNQGIDGEL